MPNKPASKVLDTSFERIGQYSFTFKVVQRVDTETIRVTVHFDSVYARQSYAMAEVLTPQREWTNLASAPADGWHASLRTGSAPVTSSNRKLSELVTDLFVRAAKILDV